MSGSHRRVIVGAKPLLEHHQAEQELVIVGLTRPVIVQQTPH